jgi:UDP-GlcNAc:undecaprenyl-phosphate GlcNAc-1-phosphate transferase
MGARGPPFPPPDADARNILQLFNLPHFADRSHPVFIRLILSTVTRTLAPEAAVSLPIDSGVWVIALVVGAATGLLLTRLARELAARIGLVDAPDGRRKIQPRAVPVAGGPAVLVAAVLAVLASAAVSPDVAAALTADPRRCFALLAAAILITAVGLADDVIGMRARYKLAGQVAAALVLIAGGGLLIERVSLLGWVVELGPLAGPATLVWLLVCTNALNLIDGMDGLLGTVGLIALCTFAALALMAAQTFAAAVALALAGAVLGFLWFNLPPASVYLGDAGSMLIGLVVGAVAVSASLKGPATVALVAPVAVLVLPMTDTTAAVIRRKLTGRGLATTDRGHLHHVLQRNGLTDRRVLVLVAGLGLIAAAGALAGTALNNDLFAVVAAGGVVVTLVATRLFGYAELRLVLTRVSAAVRALRADGPGRELAVRLQGSADWDEVWRDLTGCARRMNLQTVCLDVNAPALHENYHARWDRSGSRFPETHLWRFEIPLFGRGQPIGRLLVVGVRDDGPVIDDLLTLAKIVETAEVRAAEVTAPARAAQPAPTATGERGAFPEVRGQRTEVR